jgi:flagellar basal-body rod modification protein FlgD
MDVLPGPALPPAAPAAPAAPPPAAAPAAAGRQGRASALTTVAGDFRTFLTLLTAQMRNQDPMKPVESTEFVAQLASFSAVEQQVRGNETLESILEVLGTGSAAGLAEWIGREVRAAAAVPFDGTRPVTLAVAPAAGAELAVLVVSDAAGAEKARLTVDPRAAELVWTGEGVTGPLPPGTYRFAVESYAAGERIATRPAEVFVRVAEVRREAEGTVLLLADGSRIAVADVTAVR